MVKRLWYRVVIVLAVLVRGNCVHGGCLPPVVKTTVVVVEEAELGICSSVF